MNTLGYLLVALVCPVTMGGVMWFMMRSGRRQEHRSRDDLRR